MFGNMFKHIFMIDKSISATFELIKLYFSGSDQMPLNTLNGPDGTGDARGPRPRSLPAWKGMGWVIMLFCRLRH